MKLCDFKVPVEHDTVVVVVFPLFKDRKTLSYRKIDRVRYLSV